MFHRQVVHAPKAIAVHLGIAFGIAWVARRASISQNPVLQFVRHWYPLPLYIYFFEELQGLATRYFPGLV